MPCTSCGSDRLAIRQKTGIEAILSKITGKRKYLCLVCKSEFRAGDRRNTPRDGDGTPTRKALKIPIN